MLQNHREHPLGQSIHCRREWKTVQHTQQQRTEKLKRNEEERHEKVCDCYL